MDDIQKVLITGGAGYVGSMLVPYLRERGLDVRVVDLCWYGRPEENPQLRGGLEVVEADIRDADRMNAAFEGCDAVIHLACISNDPSFELDPQLGRSINLDAFPVLLAAARKARVKRFVYASSSSVYGVREEPDVTEETPCTPLTDYSKFKLECEKILHEQGVGDGCYTIIRPATVCGWAPRLRLDLTVNILTIHALVNKKIRVFGGDQLRPNLNIVDMVRAYHLLLEAPRDSVHGKAFNVGYENRSVRALAHEVHDVVGDPDVAIDFEPTSDNRSYHISSEKVRRELGFEPQYTIGDAITSLCDAYRAGRIVNAMTDDRYYNIKRMQSFVASRP